MFYQSTSLAIINSELGNLPVTLSKSLSHSLSKYVTNVWKSYGFTKCCATFEYCATANENFWRAKSNCAVYKMLVTAVVGWEIIVVLYILYIWPFKSYFYN